MKLLDMRKQSEMLGVTNQFKDRYGVGPEVLASAPGRLEVLGNHTDYNNGLTLSCAIGLRCYAAVAPTEGEHVHLASTLFDDPPQAYPLDAPKADKGHWSNYILGLVQALRDRGVSVPGFTLLVHSEVPRAAGVSSSAALEMAALKALDALLSLNLSAIELAAIGQSAESSAVGAQTGLLDQLSSLLGQRDHLLQIDFDSLQTKSIVIPPGWCFVAVDSGVKHDLTKEYNDRRASCEAAAQAMGIASLRGADQALLETHYPEMPEEAALCAQHIIGENDRVREASEQLGVGDMEHAGTLMFASHQSSQDNFRNSCPELDEMIAFAQNDTRCVGARLSGGGFGGISIHLVRQSDSESYRRDIIKHLESLGRGKRWSAICATDDGAQVHRVHSTGSGSLAAQARQ